MSTGQDDLNLKPYDDEILCGHYLIASMDRRLHDQDLLGQELIRRDQLTESLHQQHMQTTREREPLLRPIIAGPHERERAERHLDNGKIRNP